MTADLESWRAISKDPSRLMFKESIDFNNLNIATLNRVILFISQGVSGEIFKCIPRFFEGVGARGGELFLIGEIFFLFLELLEITS